MKKIIIGVSVVVLVILSAMAIKLSYADRTSVATPDEPTATLDEPIAIPEEVVVETTIETMVVEETTEVTEVTEPVTEIEVEVETGETKPTEPKKNKGSSKKNNSSNSGSSKKEPTASSTPDESENSNKVYLGKFTLTAYCNCKKCCGKWAGGPTASGKMPKAGRTIAVDPKVIPLGSKVSINGKTYTAEDTGSAIKNKKIDIYFDSHSAALEFGRQTAKVYLIK